MRIAAPFCVIFVIMTSCSPAPGRASLPEGPAEVTVSMREYAFDYDSSLTAGRVVFNVVNRGQLEHRLVLLPLGDDVPPINVQLHGPQRLTVAPLASVLPRPPGRRAAFAAELLPGKRYALICSIVDPDGESHAFKGMASEFRTPGATQSPVSGR